MSSVIRRDPSFTHQARRLLIGALSTLLALWGVNAHAQTLPRWEVGIGLGVLSLPYYRGADSGRTYIAPFPYIVYRGEHVRIDDEGIRGYLFQGNRIKLNLSIAAGVPVPSDSKSVRHDMPKLHPTVEIGPSLEMKLWVAKERDSSLWLKMPLRTALSVGWSDISQQGWIFAPYVEYSTRYGEPIRPWILNLSIGPQFADRDYHRYFYEVAPLYATATRPEYHPDAGYSGSRMTVTIQKRWGDYWVGAFARYDALQGASFIDSPLVQQHEYFATGIAVIKLLAVSKETEQRP